MAQKNEIKLLDEKLVRTIWNDKKEKWYFSITGVIEVLTDTNRPGKYRNDLKKNCRQKEVNCPKKQDT